MWLTQTVQSTSLRQYGQAREQPFLPLRMKGALSWTVYAAVMAAESWFPGCSCSPFRSGHALKCQNYCAFFLTVILWWTAPVFSSGRVTSNITRNWRRKDVWQGSCPPQCQVHRNSQKLISRWLLHFHLGIDSYEFMFNVQCITDWRLLLKWVKHVLNSHFMFNAVNINMQNPQKPKALRDSPWLLTARGSPEATVFKAAATERATYEVTAHTCMSWLSQSNPRGEPMLTRNQQPATARWGEQCTWAAQLQHAVKHSSPHSNLSRSHQPQAPKTPVSHNNSLPGWHLWLNFPQPQLMLFFQIPSKNGWEMVQASQAKVRVSLLPWSFKFI